MDVYQGGTAFQVYSPQGSKPLESLKITGAVRKEFDKPSRSQVVVVEQATSRITVPKVQNGALLVHPIVVVQLFAINISAIAIEFTVVDSLGKRRLMFSNSFTSIQPNPQHTKFPFQLLPKQVWLDLIFDVRQLHRNVYETRAPIGFRGVESITISGAGCRVRRIYTLREIPSGIGPQAYHLQVPSQFTLPPEVEQQHLIITRGDELMGRGGEQGTAAAAAAAAAPMSKGSDVASARRAASTTAARRVPQRGGSSGAVDGGAAPAATVARHVDVGSSSSTSACTPHDLSDQHEVPVVEHARTSCRNNSDPVLQQQPLERTLLNSSRHAHVSSGIHRAVAVAGAGAAMERRVLDDNEVVAFQAHPLFRQHPERQTTAMLGTSPSLDVVDDDDDDDEGIEFVVQHRDGHDGHHHHHSHQKRMIIADSQPCEQQWMMNTERDADGISGPNYRTSSGGDDVLHPLTASSQRAPRIDPPSIESSHRQHRSAARNPTTGGDGSSLSRPQPMVVTMAAEEGSASTSIINDDTSMFYDAQRDAYTARQLRLSESIVNMGGDTVAVQNQQPFADAVRRAAQLALEGGVGGGGSGFSRQPLPPQTASSAAVTVAMPLPPVPQSNASMVFHTVAQMCPSSANRYNNNNASYSDNEEDDEAQDAAVTGGSRQPVVPCVDPQAFYYPPPSAEPAPRNHHLQPPAAGGDPAAALTVKGAGPRPLSAAPVYDVKPLPHAPQPLQPQQEVPPPPPPSTYFPMTTQQAVNPPPDDSTSSLYHSHYQNHHHHPHPSAAAAAALSPPPPVRLSQELGGCSPPDPHMIQDATRFEYDPIVGCYFDRVTNRFVKPPPLHPAHHHHQQQQQHQHQSPAAVRGQSPGQAFRPSR